MSTLQYEKVEGLVANLSVHPANIHFLKTIRQEKKLAAAVSIGQAISGEAGAVMSAQAAADEGDPVESFTMNVAGETVTGAFWKTTFEINTHVIAIGSKSGGVFRATAVIDPEKKIIWMQPHCERGTRAKSRSLARGCAWFILFSAMSQLILTTLGDPPHWPMLLGLSMATIVTLIVTVGWSWRDFMAFAQEMNTVATILGWPAPEETDLLKNTRLARKAGKPDLPMGVYYF